MLDCFNVFFTSYFVFNCAVVAREGDRVYCLQNVFEIVSGRGYAQSVVNVSDFIVEFNRVLVQISNVT